MDILRFAGQRTLHPAQLLRTAWKTNRSLTVFALAAFVTVLVALVGMVVDPRAADAAPGWGKSVKFALSFGIYSATFLWLLTYVRAHPLIVGLLTTATAAMSLIEVGIITLQVVRRTYSHFNNSTPFDDMLFGIMGNAVVVIWLMALGLGVLLLVQRLPDRTLAWGLRLGVLVTLVGMLIGFLMTTPKGDQLAQNAAGHQPALIGAHTVGAPDGGPGLPFLGWSTTHGDLRVAHFIGMHAMQLLPLLGFLLSHFAPLWLQVRHRVALVAIGALGYLGVIALLAWQALRGQSFIAPDAVTLAAGVALAAAIALATTLVLAAARTKRLVVAV